VLGFDLSEIAENEETLTRTEYAQPAILTHSIAALEAYREENGNIDVDTCVGHSLGEFTALVASECLSLEDGVRLVRGRGEAMANASKDSLHKMVALMPTKHDDERLDSLLQDLNNEERGEVCDVANVNSSNQVVLSGTVRTFAFG
jgi:[acyl-carrier-protein] S-malonyltransferase